jgi:serine/threonine-protein kinase
VNLSDPGENQKEEVSSSLDQAQTTPELVEKTLDSSGGASGAFMAASSGAMITVAPNAPEQLVGSIFDGKYEILSLLGQGGMSAVFKARNLVLNRIVAIKILLGNRNLNEQSLLRFQQEARAASHLDHPNIVKVHDFSVSIDHAPYMVMDYVEGSSIAELIALEGQLDPYRSIDLILQACDALEHAHEQGVVHRDLKPSNIMVTSLKGGRELAKIVDFGVAKLLEEEQAATPQLTRTGEVFGSPLYMSPEQCLGKKVDARSDIYSLACVLFEELTGAPPFRAENVLATMHMHISDPPPELTKIRSDLHNGARLSSILLTALSKNPEQRFSSMKTFAVALKEAALKPQAGVFRRLGTHLNIFRKTQESNRQLPLLIVTSISALIVGITTWWAWQSHQALEALKNQQSGENDKTMAEFLRTEDPPRLKLEDGRWVTDDLVPIMIKEPHLKALLLHKSKVTGHGFIELTRGLGKQLKEFSCNQNRHLKPKELLEMINNLDGNVLTHISMQGVEATDDVVAACAKFKNLKTLDLSATIISPRAFERLPVMNKVDHIMLNHTTANDQTMHDIVVKFPNLEHLSIKRTNVTEKGLQFLKKLQLKKLLVIETKLSKPALDGLKNAIGPGLAIHGS